MHLLQKVLDCVPMCYRVKPRYVAGDRSAFVQDVTIPDNTVVSPGQVFTKVWESQNVGNVPWLGRRLRCVDE